MTAAVLSFGAARFGPADRAALMRTRARIAASLGAPVTLDVECGDEGSEYAVLAIDAATGEADAWAAYRVLAIVQATREPGRRWVRIADDGRECAAGNDLASLLAGLP